MFFSLLPPENLPGTVFPSVRQAAVEAGLGTVSPHELCRVRLMAEPGGKAGLDADKKISPL